MRKISMLSRLLDVLIPRYCLMCDTKLAVTERFFCQVCNMDLPRTSYVLVPDDNEMARLFFGRMEVERCAALFFYQSHSAISRVIHALKYDGYADIGVSFGMMMAREFGSHGFFDDIDFIVPVPITIGRRLRRGYNQAQKIAEGISMVTGLPIRNDVVCRRKFSSSQTDKYRLQRIENVEQAFEALPHAQDCEGCHILLVDDVVTTGATLISCAQAIAKQAHARYSVASIAFTKN